MNDNEYIAKLTVPVEDAALVASLLRKTVSEKWWEGLASYASNAQPNSATWTNKTPTDVMADVNSLLNSIWISGQALPQTILMSPRTYWQLSNWPAIALLIKSRKRRRPKNFTQRWPKWAPDTKIWTTRKALAGDLMSSMQAIKEKQ